jgi:hypothetical protein
MEVMKIALKYALVFFVALLGGFAGGVLSNFYLTSTNIPRIMQELVPKPGTVIRASAFQLVDENGNLRGEFAFQSYGGDPVLKLMDPKRYRTVVMLRGGDTPSLEFGDEMRPWSRIILGYLGNECVQPVPRREIWGLKINSLSRHPTAWIGTTDGANGTLGLWDAKTGRWWTAPR